MNCHDVREGFSAASRGGMGLTEWALMHAHVAQCENCRKEEREPLQLVVRSPQRGEPSRAPSSFTTSLTRLRVLLSSSLTKSAQAAASLIGHVRSALMIVCQRAARVAIEAAGAGVARVAGLPTRARRLLPALFTPPVQAAASLIGRVGFMSAGFARLLIWFRVSLMVAGQGAVRAAIEAARAGVKQVLASLTRLRVLVSIFFAVSAEAAGRLIAARRVGATRMLDLLIQANGTMRAVGRIVVTTSGRALSHLAARTSALRQRKGAAGARTRPLLRLCTGIVSLAVLVAAIVLLWPPQSPHNLVDRKPALAKTSAPASVSAPQPTPVAVSRPETRV